tara:strand:+ start:45 stop:746 length:702 start_codon:yes stop_codon:yes gene_type:complete
MALPSLNTPTYELTIPSTKKKIKYRPFLVKEEKILLLALESEDDKQISLAMQDLMEACILTKGIKVQELASFDVEYIFLNIRAKSIGETIDVKLICPDDGTTEVTTQIPIDKIKVKYDKDHTNQIQINDDLWVEMKYPNIDSLAIQEETIDDTFKLISKSIGKIYNEEDVWDSSTTSEKEFEEFIESMNSKQFAKIQTFFETMPSLKHTVKIRNPNTKVESSYTIEGLSNFFM